MDIRILKCCKISSFLIRIMVNHVFITYMPGPLLPWSVGPHVRSTFLGERGVFWATIYQTSTRSEFKYGHRAAILENQLRAIKLCTYVPLGKSISQTKFQSSLILGLATRGPKPKTDITPELMAGSSPNFYHIYKDTWHDTQDFDLTYFSRLQRSKVQNILQSRLVLLLFDLECSKCARTSWFVFLLFDLECSNFVLINRPTLHCSWLLPQSPRPSIKNPRWAHGPWTISLKGQEGEPFLTVHKNKFSRRENSLNWCSD
jgi:hypothetical protein